MSENASRSLEMMEEVLTEADTKIESDIEEFVTQKQLYANDLIIEAENPIGGFNFFFGDSSEISRYYLSGG